MILGGMGRAEGEIEGGYDRVSSRTCSLQNQDTLIFKEKHEQLCVLE